MLRHRRDFAATARVAERLQREHDAPRLATEVPRLERLELALEERRDGVTLGESRHVRRIVVERAPALFEFPCSDKACAGGGHDMTYEVMRVLRANLQRVDFEDACGGTVGSAQCSRVLRCVGIASYRGD